jgi:hypothetical protein
MLVIVAATVAVREAETGGLLQNLAKATEPECTVSITRVLEPKQAMCQIEPSRRVDNTARDTSYQQTR